MKELGQIQSKGTNRRVPIKIYAGRYVREDDTCRIPSYLDLPTSKYAKLS